MGEDIEYELGNIEELKKALKETFKHNARFDTQDRVLKEMNIDLNDMPKEFWEEFYKTNQSTSYSDCLLTSANYKNKPIKMKVHIKDVVGTSNYKYSDHPLIESYYRLKRMSEHDTVPDTKSMLNSDDMALYTRFNSGEYIIEHGNNRTIALKVAYLAEMSKAKSDEEKAKIDEKYSYEVMVNTVPVDKETSEKILFFFNDGYKIENECETVSDCKYTLTKDNETITITSKEELDKLFESEYSLENIKDYSELVKRLSKLSDIHSKAFFNAKHYDDYNERVEIIDKILPGFNSYFEKGSFFKISQRSDLFSDEKWLENLFNESGLDLENLNYEEIEKATEFITKKIEEKLIEAEEKNILEKIQKCSNSQELGELLKDIEVDKLSPEFAKLSNIVKFLDGEKISYEDIKTIEDATSRIGQAIIYTKNTNIRQSEEKSIKITKEIQNNEEKKHIKENKEEIERLFTEIETISSNINEIESKIQENSRDKSALEQDKISLTQELEELKSKNAIIRIIKRNEIEKLEQKINNISKQEDENILEGTNLESQVSTNKTKIEEIEQRIKTICGNKLSGEQIKAILNDGITIQELEDIISRDNKELLEIKFKKQKNIQDIDKIADILGIDKNEILKQEEKSNKGDIMNPNELVEIIKNKQQTKDTYENAIKWCSENIKTLDMTNKDHVLLYEASMHYLMKHKLAKWDKEDACLATSYLAKKFAHSIGIDGNVGIEILEKEEYEKEYGETSNAMCENNGDGTFSIIYSDKVTDRLLSDNADDFLNGFQTVFHEVVHTMQNSMIQRKEIEGEAIPYTKSMYIMALETISRKVDSEFYKKNYAKLLKENHAEKIGLKQAMATIQKYNPVLFEKYNQEEIAKRMEQYDENFYESEISLFNNNGSAINMIDTGCCTYIMNNPEALEKFPILKLAFNNDGTKKDITQILKDRREMLKSDRNPEQINELYKTIANQKNFRAGGLKGTKSELEDLDTYIRETGTDDEFVYDLIRFRLQKAKLDPEKIEEYMKNEYEAASNARAEKQDEKENKPLVTSKDIAVEDRDKEITTEEISDAETVIEKLKDKNKGKENEF